MLTSARSARLLSVAVQALGSSAPARTVVGLLLQVYVLNCTLSSTRPVSSLQLNRRQVVAGDDNRWEYVKFRIYGRGGPGFRSYWPLFGQPAIVAGRCMCVVLRRTEAEVQPKMHRQHRVQWMPQHLKSCLNPQPSTLKAQNPVIKLRLLSKSGMLGFSLTASML